MSEYEARMAEARQLYEADVKARPTYHDGSPRKSWNRLPQWVRETWRIRSNEAV